MNMQLVLLHESHDCIYFFVNDVVLCISIHEYILYSYVIFNPDDYECLLGSKFKPKNARLYNISQVGLKIELSS